MIKITTSAKQTQAFGQEFAKNLAEGAVVCLRGDLGAGKTTLVQGIAKGLGVARKINSPTFIIARRYHRLWHVDLYRLNSLDEAKAMGIEEILEDKDRIILIEWPAKIESLLPRKRWEIKLEHVSENERKIRYETLS